MKTMTCADQSTASKSDHPVTLLLTFELGERTWKLGFTTGIGQRPRWILAAPVSGSVGGDELRGGLVEYRSAPASAAGRRPTSWTWRACCGCWRGYGRAGPSWSF